MARGRSALDPVNQWIPSVDPLTDFRRFLARPELPGAFPQVSAPIDFYRILDLSSLSIGWGKVAAMDTHQIDAAEEELLKSRRLDMSKHRSVILRLAGLAIVPFMIAAAADSKADGAVQLSPGGELRRITDDPAADYHVKWSPDGKTLAFVSTRSGEPKIWLVPSQGGQAVMLETGLSGDHHISWSPDGQQIVFDALWEGRPNIFSISVQGGAPKRLSSDRTVDFQPNWSPDGSSIAFASYRTGNAEIWVMPKDGGPATQLSFHEAADHHPAWSPDGSQIAFASNRAGNFDIWIMSASGEGLRQMTFDPSDDDTAFWSPDGKRMVFVSKRSGKQDIWIVSFSGGSPVRFTEEAENSWPNWSPDGTTIAFSSGPGPIKDIWVKDIQPLRLRNSNMTALSRMSRSSGVMAWGWTFIAEQASSFDGADELPRAENSSLD